MERVPLCLYDQVPRSHVEAVLSPSNNHNNDNNNKNEKQKTLQTVQTVLEDEAFGPLIVKAATIVESWIATMDTKRDDWQPVADAFCHMTLARFMNVDLSTKNPDACKLARALATVATFPLRWLNFTFYMHFDLPLELERYVPTACLIVVLLSDNVEAAKAFIKEHNAVVDRTCKLHDDWMQLVLDRARSYATFPVLFPADGSSPYRT